MLTLPSIKKSDRESVLSASGKTALAATCERSPARARSPAKPPLPTVEQLSLEYQEKQKQLKWIESILSTRKSELEVCSSSSLSVHCGAPCGRSAMFGI